MPLFLTTPQPQNVSAAEALAIGGSASNTLGANSVYLYAFELAVAVTFSGAKWRIGTTGGGTADVGIYDINGNLLTHTGGTTNTGSTNMSANFSGGNYTLQPGQYFMAYCTSSATDNVYGVSLGNPAAITRCRLANNSATAGVLPSTTGGYTDAPGHFPAFSLTVVGGLT